MKNSKIIKKAFIAPLMCLTLGAFNRALAEIGKPYECGGVGPQSYGASGLVSYALTGEYIRIGTTSTFMGWPEVTSPKLGDICVNMNNCGIYYGGGTMISTSAGSCVRVMPVEADMIFVNRP